MLQFLVAVSCITILPFLKPHVSYNLIYLLCMSSSFLRFQVRDGGGAPVGAGTKCNDNVSSGVSGGKLSFKCETGSCLLVWSVVYLSATIFGLPALHDACVVPDGHLLAKEVILVLMN